MRHLGSLESLQDAKSLVSFLLVQGIDCHLDQSEDDVQIWVKDEDRLKEAVGQFQAFEQNPQDPKYAAAILRFQREITAVAEKHMCVRVI